MGADATLVNMAYKAAMANVPGDYSASFNKQYEGLIAGYWAQSRAIGGGLMALQKGVGEVGKSITERKTTERENIFARTNIDAIGELADQNAKQSAAETAKMKGENGQILANEAVVRAATDEMQEIKDGLDYISQKAEDVGTMQGYETELLAINEKNFRNKKDKARRNELYRKVDILKANLISEKAATVTYINGVNDDQYNLRITDRDDKELTTLRAQVSNPNFDFKKGRIKTFRTNGKLFYEYDDGRLGAQYDANVAKATLGGLAGPEPSKAERDKATRKVISHEELFGKMIPKAIETQGNLELTIHNTGSKAEETIKNSVTGGKGYRYESFTSGGAYSLENEVYADMVDGIYNSEGDPAQIVQDISSRTIKGRNYGEDTANGIANSTYEAYGIPLSEIAAADTNNDGFIGDNPFTEEVESGETLLDPKDARQLHEMLTNPIGEEQTKHAVNAIALYYTNLAEQEFNHVRGIMDGIPSPTSKGKGVGGRGGGRVSDKNLTFQFATGAKVEETGKREYVRWEPTISAITTIDKDLRAMEAKGEDSMFSEEYVNINGLFYGFTPGKGFVEMEERGSAGLFPRRRDKKGGGQEPIKYFKSVKDIFSFHNIPVQYLKGNIDTSKL